MLQVVGIPNVIFMQRREMVGVRGSIEQEQAAKEAEPCPYVASDIIGREGEFEQMLSGLPANVIPIIIAIGENEAKAVDRFEKNGAVVLRLFEGVLIGKAGDELLDAFSDPEVIDNTEDFPYFKMSELLERYKNLAEAIRTAK